MFPIEDPQSTINRIPTTEIVIMHEQHLKRTKWEPILDIACGSIRNHARTATPLPPKGRARWTTMIYAAKRSKF